MNSVGHAILVTGPLHPRGPHIDWASLSPLIVLAGGALLVLLVGLLRSAFIREKVVPVLSIAAFGGAIGCEIARFHHPATIVSGALRIDDLALIIDLICAVSAIATVLMSVQSRAPHEAGHGEYHSLLLFSALGMAILVSSVDIITLFIGIELLSIPLYVLCASEHRREGSLESGLKYLVIGSVGSATLVYGLAMLYGATGATGFTQIAVLFQFADQFAQVGRCKSVVNHSGQQAQLLGAMGNSARGEASLLVPRKLRGARG